MSAGPGLEAHLRSSQSGELPAHDGVEPRAILSSKLGEGRAKDLEEDLISGRLALWVRVRTPERERRAAETLQKNGAERVEVADIELEKRLADLSLADIRPDPLLSDERLGT